MLRRLKKLKTLRSLPWRKIAWISTLAILLIVLISKGIDRHISQTAAPFVFHKVQDVPSADVALVLGTSPKARKGYENLYFRYRMDAAAQLYHAGKVRVLVLSGDNRRHTYNEPLAMREALQLRGVPDSAMVSDFAGFRTFDSVVRCAEVFGASRFIVVSQQFHVERALFLARAKKYSAVGYCAVEVPNAYGWKTRVREWFARSKAWLDVYVLGTEPYFGGPPEPIEGLF